MPRSFAFIFATGLAQATGCSRLAPAPIRKRLPLLKARNKSQIFSAKLVGESRVAHFKKVCHCCCRLDESEASPAVQADLPDWVKAMAPAAAETPPASPAATAPPAVDVPDWLQRSGQSYPPRRSLRRHHLRFLYRLRWRFPIGCRTLIRVRISHAH